MSDAARETPCPRDPQGTQHCEHWYDDAGPCCFCGDDGDNTHGDHHPSLDCAICAERIADGRTTYEQIYRLEENRYRNRKLLPRRAALHDEGTPDG